MSEADSPNKELGLSEPVEPADTATCAAETSALNESDASDSGWQTIDFPGAVSIDAIPIEAEVQSHQSKAELISTPEAVSNDITALAAEDLLVQVEQLRQENTELRDRLAQLEQDLFQGQVQWQMEAVRSAQNETLNETPEAISIDVNLIQQELAAAQERIGYLFQELELSHQAAQRQQILVETLTEQLESSQERIAQLERDCTLTQQRYNEQMQQALQAENTCRDLRMRLHRQQRHTLQFKAALEKCLEMPAPYRQNHFVPEFDVGNSGTVAAQGSSLGRLLTAKNQPVKPWSAPLTTPAQPVSGSSPTDQSALPKPLSKLIHPDSETADVEELTASYSLLTNEDASAAQSLTTEPHDITELMSLMFPTDAVPASVEQDPLTSHNQPNEIFDVSPFFAADVHSEAIFSDDEPAVSLDELQDERLMQLLNSVPFAGPISDAFNSGLEQGSQPADDPLWTDLAKLIDPLLTTEGLTPIESVAIDPDVEPAEQITVEPTVDVNDAAEVARSQSLAPDSVEETGNAQPVKDEVAPIRKPLESLDWARPSKWLGRQEAASVPQSTARPPSFVAVAASNKLDKSVSANSASEPLPASWPSPVVYPLRPAKKLASLAAVELPTFPRPR